MYIQISIQTNNPDEQELLIARLQDAAEGFEQTATSLQVFFKKENFDARQIPEQLADWGLHYSSTALEEQNWNQLWESNFEPVIVDDFAGIRAGFHAPLKSVIHEIIITPKMSFGTGHHATTYLMIQAMRQLDFTGKAVLDFGTGTGLLAILASRLGARPVLANDIDSWSIENARENFQVNQTNDIELFQSGDCRTGRHLDIILANINRNVLLDNINALAGQLRPGGRLLMSGILDTDQQQLQKAAESQGFSFQEKTQKGNWICLLFNKLE